jgi:hypothetical protein
MYNSYSKMPKSQSPSQFEAFLYLIIPQMKRHYCMCPIGGPLSRAGLRSLFKLIFLVKQTKKEGNANWQQSVVNDHKNTK